MIVKERNNKGPAKYTHNKKYFSEPNINNAYWAGFIAADGCIVEDKRLINPWARLSIKLAQVDAFLLEKFRQDIAYTGEVKYILNSKRPAVTLQINQAYEIIYDLNRLYNITPRKSLTLAAPKKSLPIEIQLAFIKGYIDGDGCIHLRKVKGRNNQLRLFISGSEKFLNWVKEIFDEIAPKNNHYCISKPRKCSTSKSWEYIVNGDRAIKILTKLNEIPVEGLTRKWLIFEEYIKN